MNRKKELKGSGKRGEQGVKMKENKREKGEK